MGAPNFHKNTVNLTIDKLRNLSNAQSDAISDDILCGPIPKGHGMAKTKSRQEADQ